MALAALLGACATPPQYSKSEDPFKALSPKASRAYAAAKVCLLLSENTNKAMEHLTEVRNLMSAFGGAGADLDPRRVVSDLMEALNARFRETVRVGALTEVGPQGCNLALGLELKLKVGQMSFQDVSVEISGTVLDDKGRPLDTVLGAYKGTVPYPNFAGPGPVFTSAWNTALSAFGKGLDDSKPISAFVAGLPRYAEPGTAMAAAPTTIDLAFWDSIKNSANPVDFQAYLRKFPTGAFESLARSRLAGLGEAAPVRLNPIAQPTAGKLNFGNYHALVIGIDNYRSVTPLKTAVGDAKTVAELLQKEYGFKVTLLLDATRNQMLDSFDDLRRTLTHADNLLIYYAGHGHLDADSDRGFWLPVDADANRRANWLSNSDIADVVRGTRAKHVLVVADSCYAGTLTRSLAVQMTALDDFSRLAQKRARTALVSGGLEPVEDAGGGKHSVFAKAFIDALWANTGVVDMSQIFSSMRRQVVLSAQQTPQYSDIRQVGHEGGDFIFVRRK
ncbi:MAG: hypothetical protein A3H93_16560 [Rhodocyclales bacterium RIFCSPLOWO2_02_FULL_63_24]|nr:MAG: hypothetical protein A3H93_16560 [Rhodocyclales bacterium RIFCSPLOWO2_02_FULL_63_24]